VARHYLDHASTSPPRPEVVDAVVRWLGAADPGRSHAEGLAARVAVEEARERVAALLGARSREVVFTSGATEAVVTATWMATERGDHVVLPAVEHRCVREASARHATTVVGVDATGRVDPDEVLDAVVPGRTALVHCQLANHEVGTIQPVAEVAARCREAGVLVHVDAAAAAGHVAVDFAALGADLLSVSAHKLGGPPGIGCLLVRRGLRLRPLVVGGDQERARRAGMENVPGIVGFGAVATTLSDGGLATEGERAAALTAPVIEAARSGELGPGVEVLGDPAPAGRLPSLVCMALAGVEAEPVLLGLDAAGVAVHSGSSCASESLEPSPVLEAMGADAERSLRLSVGWSTMADDVDAFCRALPAVVERLRALAS